MINVIIKKSTNPNKKYDAFINDKKISFGASGYSDYTKHKDKSRRKNYLTRSKSIKGNWKTNKYSPNNLSIHLLW